MIDIIRFIAIFLLLTAHIGQEIGNPLGSYFGIPNFYQVSLGGLAVTMYLFVSGAGLELTYSKYTGSLRIFIVKRLLRIYPVYYMSLLTGILVSMVLAFRTTGGFVGPVAELSAVGCLLSLTGLHAFAGQWGGPFLDTSWFIGLIMSLYLMFPIVEYPMRNRPHVTVLCLFIISLLARLVLGTYSILPTRPLDWFPLCRIFEFSAGIYAVRVLSSSILEKSFPSAGIRAFVAFVNDISFPLFLVHYPLLFLISFFTARDFGMLLSISLYLFISISVSWLILSLDKVIPRDAIMNIMNRRIIAGNS